MRWEHKRKEEKTRREARKEREDEKRSGVKRKEGKIHGEKWREEKSKRDKLRRHQKKQEKRREKRREDRIEEKRRGGLSLCCIFHTTLLNRKLHGYSHMTLDLQLNWYELSGARRRSIFPFVDTRPADADTTRIPYVALAYTSPQPFSLHILSFLFFMLFSPINKMVVN